MRSCSSHNLKLHHPTRRPGSDSCCPRPVWRGQTGRGESGVIKVADKTLQLQFCSRARWRWGLEFNQWVSARRNKKRGGKSGKMKQAALGRPRGLKPATSCGGLSSKTFLLVPLSGVTAEAASHLHFFFFLFFFHRGRPIRSSVCWQQRQGWNLHGWPCASVQMHVPGLPCNFPRLVLLPLDKLKRTDEQQCNNVLAWLKEWRQSITVTYTSDSCGYESGTICEKFHLEVQNVINL